MLSLNVTMRLALALSGVLEVIVHNWCSSCALWRLSLFSWSLVLVRDHPFAIQTGLPSAFDLDIPNGDPSKIKIGPIKSDP